MIDEEAHQECVLGAWMGLHAWWVYVLLASWSLKMLATTYILAEVQCIGAMCCEFPELSLCIMHPSVPSETSKPLVV